MNEHVDIDLCLLIPCYNNFQGLIESLRTVVYHKGRMLIVVVDDGSKEIISRAAILNALGDNRPVIIITNKKNQGITISLNNGLRWIKENTSAKYIARLDCGDTCDPERFFIQAAYFDQHPETGLLGSWCRFTERGTGVTYVYKTPLAHEEINREMYTRNVFIHPTVMFRTSLIEQAGYYPDDYPFAEDYAYFWTMIKITRTHIVDKILVVCEFNRHGISLANKGKQLAARKRVVKAFGTNRWMKWKGLLRLNILFVLPKWLSLVLKQRKS